MEFLFHDSIMFLYFAIIFMHILIAEGVTSDDIFGIHTELKLPSSKIQSHLAIGDEDNTELESVSGKSKMYFESIIELYKYISMIMSFNAY